jgi:hypothetical protein
VEVLHCLIYYGIGGNQAVKVLSLASAPEYTGIEIFTL